jgi:hypothetical protein
MDLSEIVFQIGLFHAELLLRDVTLCLWIDKNLHTSISLGRMGMLLGRARS